MEKSDERIFKKEEREKVGVLNDENIQYFNV